jgi:hypothetical protein
LAVERPINSLEFTLVEQFGPGHEINTIIVDLAGKVVGFGRGGEGIDEVGVAFQLKPSILVYCTEDWILLRDSGLLSISCSCLVSFPSWRFIVRIAVDELRLLGEGATALARLESWQQMTYLRFCISECLQCAFRCGFSTLNILALIVGDDMWRWRVGGFRMTWTTGVDGVT